MEVRILQKSELLPALHLVWEVFAEDVAPSYTPEGVAEFQRFIKYDNMRLMYERGEIIFFGAFEGAKLCGVMAVKSIGHICLFYVKKECQGKGTGRMLFTAVYHFCAKQLRAGRITVNAAPEAAKKYEHMGMRRMDVEQNINGMRYVPMEMYVSPADMQPVQNKKGRAGWIAGGVIAGVIGLVLIIAGGTMLIKNMYKLSRQAADGMGNYQWDDDDPMNPDSPLWDERDKYGDDDAEGISDAVSSGAAAIPEYIADNLPYEIKEETYTYTDDEKQSTLISFSVKYPMLQGLDKDMQEKINGEIKKCAMSTVDRIYTNPSQEFKEKILGTANPILASSVTYKVCYANDRFVSIVFEDMGAAGGQEDAYQNLRTLNIGLKDGKVYTVKDIVNLDGRFIEEWLEGMRSEAQENNFLAELDEEDMIKTLGGESIDGNYAANFFVDKDGVEIGYDLNYVSGDPADLNFVWVTAPFTFEEIKPYQKDKEFWGFFD
ncbi:MAG: GNAT family N-acetyltransferase [Dorea sp.]|nr:GNAT family N-acetyltransferase [Dorea sp.]